MTQIMKATQVIKPGQVEIIETAVPELKSGHALIRLLHLSLCGSDIFMLKYQPQAAYPTGPGVSGHEVVGTIEAIDASDSKLSVGQNVLVLIPALNGMSEYFLAPIEDILPLPSKLPIEHYLQAQQLGTVIYACKHLPINVIGKTVVVVGQGSAGLWFNFMLKRMGAHQIIGVDLLSHRLNLSQYFGATETILNSPDIDIETAVRAKLNGRLADLVIEAAGEPDSINLTHTLVKAHGALLYFGIFHGHRLDFDYGTFFEKYCRIQTISGTWNEKGHPSTHQALALIHHQAIDVSPILTHRFPFSKVLEAYQLQEGRQDEAIKILIDMV
ncbi:MAG: zinc-binding dehydrogenase [Chloroflexota bacterium]